MKKLLLLTVMLISATALFSQVTLLAEWEFGPTAFSPSITFNGSPDDEIISHIKITNTGATALKVKIATEVLSQVENTTHQLCWAGACFSPPPDTTPTFQALEPGESTEEFSGHIMANGTFGISAIRYTFFDMDDPANAVSVMVMYNSLFSISSESGDSAIAEHTRMISGPVDDTLQGMITIHNHAPVDLNLISFKRTVFLQENSTNWFEFSGTEYPFGVDTSAMATIPASSTDESFHMYYDPNGTAGVSQVIYVFLDPLNEGSYALFWIHYNALATGISDEILANTSFSPAYPNPASSYISFDYDIPAGVDRAEILITNLAGAAVYQGRLNGNIGTERIDVSELSGGIYFATLRLNNQAATTQKILVQ
jgi:hypothetical protein